MKTQFSKKVLAILASAVLLVCSFAGTFVVSAEDPIELPVVVGGKTYFIAAAMVDGVQPNVTVDLGDGAKTYKTTSMVDALNRAGALTPADKPVVGIYGNLGDTGNSSMAGHNEFTTPIEVIGVTADAAIGASWRGFKFNGPVTLDNFKINVSQNSDENLFIPGYNATFGENLTSTSWLWFTPVYGGPKGETSTVVINSGSLSTTYFNMLGMDGASTVGSASNKKYMHVTINNLKVTKDTGYGNEGGINMGSRNGDSTFNGNAVLIVNGGTYASGEINGGKTNTSGAVYNGILSIIVDRSVNISVADRFKAQVDYYVLNDKTMGTVDVKDIKADNHTFVITPTAGFAPLVNGQPLELVNGVYEYTPTPSDAMQTINITYADPNAPVVEEINGEKFVFVSADKSVDYNGKTYNAFETFALGYKEIAPFGGNIVVEGTQELYTASTTTTAIKVIGLGKSATTLKIHNAQPAPVYGELYLKDLTLGHLHGDKRFKADRLTLDNVADGTGGLWFVGFVTGQANGATCYLDLKSGSSLNLIGVHESSSISSSRFDNMHFIINGSIGWNPRNSQAVYGNLTYIVNSSSGMSNKNISTSTNPTGALTIIFNNGVTNVEVGDTSGNVDYRLNVATGGYANIKTEGSATTAPTFVITNNKEGVVPVVNGVQLTDTNGEYLFTPDAKGTYAVTFFDPNAPKVYDIEGEKFAFVAADGKVEYNGEAYNAYATFELAYKAIASVGGTIMVEDRQVPYTAKGSKPITVLGLGAGAELDFTSGKTLYGTLYIDNIKLYTPTYAAGVYVTNLTLGKNVTTSAHNLWFMGFNNDEIQAGDTVKLHLAGNGGVDLINAGHDRAAGAAEKPINVHMIIDDNFYINWDQRVSNTVYGNLTYTYNTNSRVNNKKLSAGTVTGAFSVIFNNGVTGHTISNPENVDYVLNVAKGGYAYVKTEGDVQTAPVFVITAPEGKVPVVGNKPITKTAGEYLYQPTGKETDITFIDEVSVDVLTGAAVRYGQPTGLRFITNINGLDGLAAIGATYQAYTMIAPIDYVNAVGTFTKEAFDAADKTYLNIALEKDAYIGDGVNLPAVPLYNAAIVNIKEGNYDRNFAARSYVVITYADGNTETIYSDFSETDNVRSVKYVAQECLATNDYDNDNQKAILEGFAG